MKDYQEWPGAVAAIMLIFAIFALPYGYYSLLRWVVTAVSIYVAVALSESNDSRLWVFIGIALLFNPIHPYYSTRSFWFFADLVSAGLFLAYSKKSVIKGRG